MKINAEQFKEQGFVGPFKLIDQTQADRILDERFTPLHLLTWYKSRHERSLPIVKAAAAPLIVSTLRDIFGRDDILLWGSQFIGQHPNESHGWHLDVEFGSCEGVTLWMGLKNLNEKTSVSVITRSHLLNTVPQELKKKYGTDVYDDEAVLREAQKLDPRCDLKTFHLQTGEFIIWSGRAWHNTRNSSNKIRRSIIFQYSTTENTPKLPLDYNYPNTKWSEAKPPCLLISGTNQYTHNAMISREQLDSTSKFGRFLEAKYFKALAIVKAVKRRIFRQSLQQS